MEFEDILKQVGDYGRYQKRLLFLFLVPSSVIFSLLCMNTFFMLSEPDHWCTVDEISHLPKDEQIFFSRPFIKDSKEDTIDKSSKDGSKEAKELLPDKCHKYDINYRYVASLYDKNMTKDIMKMNGNYNWMNTSDYLDIKSMNVSKCNHWTFDKTNYDETAVTYVSKYQTPKETLFTSFASK